MDASLVDVLELLMKATGMLVAIALAAFPGSPAIALDFYEAGEVACETFTRTAGTPQQSATLDPIIRYLSNSKEGPALGTACDIGNYVRAACATHPSYNVRQAVAFLLVAVRRRMPLPKIPECGT